MMTNINQYYNMETTIIALLVVALAVLTAYIIVTRRKDVSDIDESNHQAKALPDIVGRPKKGKIYKTTNNNNHTQIRAKDEKIDNIVPFNTDKTPVIHNKESNEFAGAHLDWEDEEEEMQRITAFNANGGFATGVTFDELATAAKLLQRQSIEASEKQNAAKVFSKIDGTELLDLLESRLGDASKRIAVLLDKVSST